MVLPLVIALMLIDHYDLEVFTPPCDPGAERYAARARLTSDISGVLPYLNATLRGAVYLPKANALTWKKGGHNTAFHAYEVAVSNVEDREGAEQELSGLIDLINRTWERRAEIRPDHETHQRPTPMALYQWLPKTNCKQCGEATCYSFALQLGASLKSLSDCPPLADPQYAQQRAALEALVIEAPAIGKGRARSEPQDAV